VEILRRRRLIAALAAPAKGDYLLLINRNRPMPDAHLQNRALIDIDGDDAEHLLQSIITTDLAAVKPGEAWPGALLTPQGKILFEFLISRRGEGFRLETADEVAEALIKRLTLYRLRAKVTFARRDPQAVDIRWDLPASDAGLADMRFAKAGIALFRGPAISDAASGDIAAYHALRIEHGISGGGEDGPAPDAFPHDLLMDLNGGLNFRKGCYIGQEVVSRMQHRGTARRRLVTITAAGDMAAVGSALSAGGKEIGTVLSAHGSQGLAIVRVDKAGAAMALAEPILAGGVAVTLALPAWSGLVFPLEAEASAP
jgi:tRNA-modifying protein YgfZ